MYTRAIQILDYLCTTLHVTLYRVSSLYNHCALILHTLTSWWICVAGCHWNICFFRLFSALEAILCAILFGTVRLCQFKICQICCDVIWYIQVHALWSPTDTNLLFVVPLQVSAYKPWNSDILFHVIPTKQKKYVERVYNSIFCITEYIPDRAQPPFRHPWKQGGPLTVWSIWWSEGFSTD